MAYIELKLRKTTATKSRNMIIKDTLNYSMNPQKTDHSMLISFYECSRETVIEEFITSKEIYEKATGKSEPVGKEIISYLIIQSFLPGEIEPEAANKIGYELAMNYTKGNHQFVVSTHIDRGHIHNHIDINSTTLDCNGKLNNKWNSVGRIRKMSDKLCKQYGFSIIPETQSKGKNYGEWKAEKSGTSWKQKLRETIESVLLESDTFEDFLVRMRQAGYEIKLGKHIAFRSAGQERFTRGKRLGEEYTEAALRQRIVAKKQEHRKNIPSKNVNLFIDIQAKIAAGKGKGYERWAALFNLKEAAKTLNYITEQGITDYDLLERKIGEGTEQFFQLSEQIKQTESRMSEIQELKHQIQNYARYRDVYKQLLNSHNKPKFKEEREGELALFEKAKQAFSKLPNAKVPNMKQLQEEYLSLLDKKKKAYSEYKVIREQLREVERAKQNIDYILMPKQRKENDIQEKERD